MSATVLERLTALLTGRFGVPAEEVRAEVTFAELDLDSLALVEFAMSAEHEFGIPFGEDDLTPQSTVDDAGRLIGSRLAGSDAVGIG
ncbi:phosphopantetheine-binding protein [Actinophytocola sp.]|uniref:phosphopantetheine-binding protein n=1 Tax=Actinophytocola sp. TaxID=1872138 RepID=UPI002D7F8B6B|nr:phosphopantetheine-binding protein [Actinophytocola sp.]HET9139831.1 phosphopantetheine-binding protein [Actinophytocola sp.]HEU5111651.1 phosphopantetheine-binding protein [Micromonosporaceae bacterium]